MRALIDKTTGCADTPTITAMGAGLFPKKRRAPSPRESGDGAFGESGAFGGVLTGEDLPDRLLGVGAQAIGAVALAELRHDLALDLSDALAGQAEVAADLVERAG